MKTTMDALAGYILAVFTAALVITISITPVASWRLGTTAGWLDLLTDFGIFWASVAVRIAIAAAIPAIIGIVIANLTGLRTTFFYCLWGIATALGLSLMSGTRLSLGSLITLAVAGLAAGLAYRFMNKPAT